MEYFSLFWRVINSYREFYHFEKEKSIEGLLFGLDFFGHAIVYGLASFFSSSVMKCRAAAPSVTEF